MEHKLHTGPKLSDFKILKELGRGSFGVVYKVQSLLNSCIYVLKKVGVQHLSAKYQREALREVQILRRVSHNYIIKYYASFVEDEYLYILMEFAGGGDMHRLILRQREKKEPFSEHLIWQIANELLSAVFYLHSNCIIHRDIKCLNIFLTKDFHVKLGDLGVSKTVVEGTLEMSKVGTPLYLSPEIIKQMPYDFKVDV